MADKIMSADDNRRLIAANIETFCMLFLLNIYVSYKMIDICIS